MKVWFTSDTHFGHEGIVTHGRPFGNAAGMDAVIMENWNRLVQPGDSVYHCGDFAWKDPRYYRSRLKGQIHLVLGNHDRLKAGDAELFSSVSDIKKVKVEGQLIYLCHYAMRVWNRSHFGSWHLYGHSHGNLADDPHALSLDCGVDCHSFAPISFEEVAALMAVKQWQPVDHHR